MKHHIAACVGLASMMIFSGCSGTAIALKESMGYAKREQLVDEVQEARDEQQEAKEQFASALDEFLSLPGVDGGELEAKYEQLRDAFEDSEDRADDVRSEIKDVERVGEALFEEWEEEIDEYTSDTLRRSSEDQMRSTRRRYDQLLSAMNRAAEKMDPVIDAFRDQVLFLKHNLNARAIASLEQNLASLESEIALLIADMERSIAEANAFIEEMETGG